MGFCHPAVPIQSGQNDIFSGWHIKVTMPYAFSRALSAPIKAYATMPAAQVVRTEFPPMVGTGGYNRNKRFVEKQDGYLSEVAVLAIILTLGYFFIKSRR
jgi:hypothetical protein